MRPHVDVVGAGPNGLVAALVLQRAGCGVLVRERMPAAGGGLRTEALTRPGHLHDSCAAVHPLAVASPFLRTILPPGVWLRSPAAVAHPFDDGSALILWQDLASTAAQLGRDGRTYVNLLGPLVSQWDALVADVLAPPHLPRAPAVYARFARLAVSSALGFGDRFNEQRVRALFGGLAAHGTVPLERPRTAAFGLVLALAAHADGWPIARGGSGRLADVLLADLERAGGELRLDDPVRSLSELDGAVAAVLDTSPREFARLAAGRLSPRAARRLGRFRYGCGVHKVDWVLSAPVPWRAGDCALAATVHVGGSLGEIAAALRAAAGGEEPDPPFVLLGQPTLFDPSRAPAGEHNAWAYCAVPLGSTRDFTPAIERQVERFAPGFRDTILARHVRTAAALEQHNPNLQGGSLAGSAHAGAAFFLGPFGSLRPYRTPLERVYLCSAATPPGPGVHGMCGYYAARQVLHELRLDDVGLYKPSEQSIL